jgi:SAM-dependent methyltransferase
MRTTQLNAANVSLLEVGTGTGTLAVAAPEAWIFDYVGVEPNTELAAVSRSRLRTGQVVVASLPNLPTDFKDRFDVALAVHVVEHATNGYEARAWVSEMLRCVKPGGFVVLVSPQISDFKTYFWDIDWSHAFPTSTSNLSQIVVDLGAEVRHARVMRLGSARPLVSVVGYWLSILIPVRLTNWIGRRLVGRDLGTGLKAAVLWGVTLVVGRKS